MAVLTVRLERLIALGYVGAMLALLAATAMAMPSAQEPPADSRVVVLERQLLERDKQIVELKADGAVCAATTEQVRRELQSVLLSQEVAGVILKLKTAHPETDWVWDNDTRRIRQKENP